MALSGIYAIEDKRGFLYYGSSINIEKRWSQHKNDLKRNSHGNPKLQAAWNKYGEMFFSFYIVEAVPDITNLVEREQYWIELLINTETFFYNCSPTAGSTLGKKHTEQAKQKIARKAKGRKSPNKGKKLSVDTKQKMSNAKKGKTPANYYEGMQFSESRKRNIALSASNGKVYSFVGPDYTVYTDVCNLSEFARAHNLDVSTLAKVAKNKLKTHKGFSLFAVKST